MKGRSRNEKTTFNERKKDKFAFQTRRKGGKKVSKVDDKTKKSTNRQRNKEVCMCVSVCFRMCRKRKERENQTKRETIQQQCLFIGEQRKYRESFLSQQRQFFWVPNQMKTHFSLSPLLADAHWTRESKVIRGSSLTGQTIINPFSLEL